MHIKLDPQGPFSLEVARSFSCGLFTASRTCSADGAVRFAFTSEDDFALGGARVREGLEAASQVRAGALHVPAASLQAELFGAATKQQLQRILGVDRDARPFYALKDPVVQAALKRSPGFRPVVFFSPWAAAGWSVLTQRLRMSQAARIAEELAREAGDVVQIDGNTVASFPRPQTFLSRSGFAGLTSEKWSRLQTVARAALEGKFSMKELAKEGAREKLLELRGVGEWTADAILIRGVGPSDVLPVTEPTLQKAVTRAYGKKVEEVAQGWAPFRTWVSIMLIREYMGARS